MDQNIFNRLKLGNRGARKLAVLGLLIAMPFSSVNAQTGLPWESGFETGDFSEWNGYSRGSFVVSQSGPREGEFCVSTQLVANTLNHSYYEHYFGDHVWSGLDPVNEIYLEFSTRFDAGYDWPLDESHKLALLNLTDGEASARRYQVYVFVNSEGEYAVDHSYIDTWQFMGLPQNVGAPQAVRFGQWDDLKLRVRLNTPGMNNGIVQLWVNGVLKIDYHSVDIREGTDFAMNKLIMSSYTSDESGGSGVQWMDDWRMSETDDSQAVVRPNPPVLID